MPEAARSVTGDTWVTIATFPNRGDQPRAYYIKNTGSADVQIICPTMAGHPDNPQASDEGIVLAPTEAMTLLAPTERPGISSMWARSTGSTLTHGATA